jgi:hypothetical protein
MSSPDLINEETQSCAVGDQFLLLAFEMGTCCVAHFWAQAILLPWPPEQLGLQACTTAPSQGPFLNSVCTLLGLVSVRASGEEETRQRGHPLVLTGVQRATGLLLSWMQPTCRCVSAAWISGGVTVTTL